MDIRIENLSKWYRGQVAVDDTTFQAKTGEILAFLGPNGAGKSTTMKIITGFLGMSKGDLCYGSSLA